MSGRLIPDGRVRLCVIALVFASILSLAMLTGRVVYTRKPFMGFYVWNLILAWLPLIFAVRVYQADLARPARWWPLAVGSILWFLFFPNAPYIVTDFLHLFGAHHKGVLPVPTWFDIVMMMSFAWTGLCLGYLSLFLMQEIVRVRRGRNWSWFFAVSMLALGSFGIYLGRFQRWNSWDVIAKPMVLVDDMNEMMSFKNGPEMTVFLATFFAFSLLSYATLYALTHLHESAPRSRSADAK